MPGPGLLSFEWKGEGYQPLVFSQDWQVALLNWEAVIDAENIGEIERHNQTDEVFVLQSGRAVLFTICDDEMQAVDMQAGVLYNVTAASWHNLIATRDASWVIVEKRDTHLYDCEYRRLTADELNKLKGLLPDWLELKPK
ncbi:MAG: hypothetical protein LWX83_01450 [Anaerolineae bacterium]|nr:hypothetical protein [Anaerolineae bacterium]